LCLKINKTRIIIGKNKAEAIILFNA